VGSNSDESGNESLGCSFVPCGSVTSKPQFLGLEMKGFDELGDVCSRVKRLCLPKISQILASFFIMLTVNYHCSAEEAANRLLDGQISFYCNSIYSLAVMLSVIPLN
jgi:hypothetical protein